MVVPAALQPRGRHRRAGPRGWRLVALVTGELAVTAGVVLGLFVFYEVVLTGWWAAQDQRGVAAELDRRWSEERARPSAAEPAVGPGQPVARLEIPRLGPGWNRVVVEGTDAHALSLGPGHYPGTARPGGTGNVGIAGHRVGRGAPFDGLDALVACDDVVLRTATRRYVYRVLPDPGAPACEPLRGLLVGDGPAARVYRSVPGKQVVDPGRVDVIAPVAGRPGVAPPASVRLLTLTTCHPRFSARQRLVVHAALVDDRPLEVG